MSNSGDYRSMRRIAPSCPHNPHISKMPSSAIGRIGRWITGKNEWRVLQLGQWIKATNSAKAKSQDYPRSRYSFPSTRYFPCPHNYHLQRMLGHTTWETIDGSTVLQAHLRSDTIEATVEAPVELAHLTLSNFARTADRARNFDERHWEENTHCCCWATTQGQCHDPTRPRATSS